MGQVGFEAVAPPELAPERLKHLQVELLLEAAASADEVLVQALIGAVVLRNAVVEVGVVGRFSRRPRAAQLGF